MNYRHLLVFALSTSLITLGQAGWAQKPDAIVNVGAGSAGIPLSPDFYGLMTEEINHAYDGGLYAELIQNRNFKADSTEPTHWSAVTENGATGEIALSTDSPLSKALPVCLDITIDAVAAGQRVGAANDGYWGIPVKPNTTYTATFYAESANGFTGPVSVDIESSDGQTIFAKGTVPAISNSWRQYKVTLTTSQVAPSIDNRFVISGGHTGILKLSLVSLFPPTYANRANGNRVDIMEKIAAMKPAFLRMPGGNYLDPGHYIWRDNVGPLVDRPGSPGAWGYPVTQGLGLLEMFEWCEDLHMLPLLAVSDGRGWLAGDADVAPLVQDALDEIQYASGSTSTPFGAQRAHDGHPGPFKLRYIEVGNEDFFDPAQVYETRFAKFYDAIRAAYPDLKIIATRQVTSRVPDIVDEHYYRSVGEMESHANQYDSYPRTGPKIFVGEWASQDEATPWDDSGHKGPTPTMNSALGDAAWMTGMERNADIVNLESYAPLLVNVNPGARQWAQNLIGYDAINSFGSPSYYAQCMFANYHGTTELPTSVVVAGTSAPIVEGGGVGVGTWNTQAKFKNSSVTANGVTLSPSDPNDPIGDWSTVSGDWTPVDDAVAQNTNDMPAIATNIHPDWKDYTFHIQAEKTGGAEGFLVLFHVKDKNNYLWWNIGGWGNTSTQIERTVGSDKSPIGPAVPMTIKSGQWYDIKVVVAGADIKCYLDNALITEVQDAPAQPTPSVFASASEGASSGSVYVHLVNISDTAKEVQVVLPTSTKLTGSGTGEVLQGDPKAINTIAAPTNVAPTELTINNASNPFTYLSPAHSVSVVKLATH